MTQTATLLRAHSTNSSAKDFDTWFASKFREWVTLYLPGKNSAKHSIIWRRETNERAHYAGQRFIRQMLTESLLLSAPRECFRASACVCRDDIIAGTYSFNIALLETARLDSFALGVIALVTVGCSTASRWLKPVSFDAAPHHFHERQIMSIRVRRR